MVRKGWTKIEVPEGWTQIIRGPRRPLAKWQPQKGKRNPSAAATNGNDVKQGVCASRCSRGCSAQESGEARGCFGHVGRGRRHFPCPSGSSRKRERKHKFGQCQNAPFLQVVFGERTQTVEVARQTTVKARESLAEAVAAQENQEALLADGELRLSQLLLEEKNNLSPFTVPPPLVDVSAEFECRMSSTICNGSWPGCGQSQWNPRSQTNESMALVPAPQSASVLMSELIEEAHAERPPGLPQGVGQARDCRPQPQAARQVRVKGQSCC